MNKPNFFIIGAQKSGTTSVANWLRSHPQAFISMPKEPGYFAFGDRGYTFVDGYGRAAPARQWVIDSFDRYMKLFDGVKAEQRVVGEASTWYLAVEGTAQRIHAHCPEAKLLVVLRNPADRAYSAWCHARRDNLEPLASFRDALNAETYRASIEFLLRYREMGCYASQLARYFELFDREQILVFLYEDLFRNFEPSWETICTFLGITTDPAPVFDRKLNRSGQPRSRLMQNAISNPRLKSLLARFFPMSLLSSVRNVVDAANLKPIPPMSADDRGFLQETFDDEILALEKILQRDLGAWRVQPKEAGS